MKKMAQNLKKICVRGYTRVSTDIQADGGVSIETQRKKIEGYCTLNDMQLIKIYEDAGISAKNTNRPALTQLLKEAQPGEKIIVCDLSRLSRNTRDAINMIFELENNDISLICLNPTLDMSSPFGKAMFTVMMAFYNLERENTVANIKANMQRLSLEGKLRTRAAFGWKFVGKDKDMEPDPEQQEVIKKIINMHKANASLSQIAKVLNQLGDNKCLNNNKTKKSENPVFYAHTVKRILIDQGLIQADIPKKVPLEQRIISHHKTAENNISQNIVRFEGSSPILEVIQ